MAKITKFNVIKMAAFQAIFGVFLGFLIGLISLIFGFIFTSALGVQSNGLFTFGAVGLLIVMPLSMAGILFVGGLLLTLLANLILKIIKGLDFDLDLTESPSTEKSITPIKPVKKQEIKKLGKIAKNSEPISQMTNSKTTVVKPAI